MPLHVFCATEGGKVMNATIRLLTERDLPATRRIIALAFGTFLGVPEPEQFRADRDYATTRWHTDPATAFVAEMDGMLVGSNFVTRWGSVGFFGPITVHPDLWDRGIGKQLIAPAMECFDRWHVTHAGLFTFAQSPKHIGLYQHYGFLPRFLTAIMSKPVHSPTSPSQWSTYSALPESEREACLRACHTLTDTLYAGLDVELEIRAVSAQGLGDTVLLWNGRELMGFAVCHCGPNTEAGHNKCYVKFGAVQSGPTGGALFDRLLDGCEALAATQSMTLLEAGVSTARRQAYRKMLERGFRTDIQGVTMHRPDDPGYNRPEVYVIDDWR